MADTIQDLEQRADRAAAEARAATLDNVRDRALRSEAAWRGLADRLTARKTGRLVAHEAVKDFGPARP